MTDWMWGHELPVEDHPEGCTCGGCGGTPDDELYEDYDQPDEDGYHWMYGHFTGTDPRDFRPDFELCTDEEIANWKADCEAWDRGEDKPAPPPGKSVYDADGNLVLHILAPRYGIGTYRYRDDDSDITSNAV